MSETKTGPVFMIGCGDAQDLAKQIDELGTDDQELIGLANHLRTFHKGFAMICVAEEDFILWPGGPDIRDIQFGGRTSVSTAITREGTFSNQIQ